MGFTSASNFLDIPTANYLNPLRTSTSSTKALKCLRRCDGVHTETPPGSLLTFPNYVVARVGDKDANRHQQQSAESVGYLKRLPQKFQIFVL